MQQYEGHMRYRIAYGSRITARDTRILATRLGNEVSNIEYTYLARPVLIRIAQIRLLDQEIGMIMQRRKDLVIYRNQLRMKLLCFDQKQQW